MTAKKRAAATDRWRHEGALTFTEIAREVRRRIAAREEIPHTLTSAAKAFGSMQIEAGALLGADGEPKEPTKP